MQGLPAASTIAPSAASQYEGGGWEDTNLDDFLKLMIAELQNQDPLDPMENSEMLQQLSHMRSIGATDQLTNTLGSVLIGQNLSTASALIGKHVNALADDGANVAGEVDRISVVPAEEGAEGQVRIHIGQHSIALKNIREVLPPTSGSADG